MIFTSDRNMLVKSDNMWFDILINVHLLVYHISVWVPRNFFAVKYGRRVELAAGVLQLCRMSGWKPNIPFSLRVLMTCYSKSFTFSFSKTVCLVKHGGPRIIRSTTMFNSRGHLMTCCIRYVIAICRYRWAVKLDGATTDMWDLSLGLRVPKNWHL